MLSRKHLRHSAGLLLAVPLSSAPFQVPAESDAGRTSLEFRLERSGLPVPSYHFVVHEDGSGTYTATYVGDASHVSSSHSSSNLASSNQAAPDLEGVAQPGTAERLTHPLALTPGTTAKLFALARNAHEFRLPCASKARNIADTGAKTMSYTGPDGAGSCTFNYTENKPVAELTTIFQGMALTLDSSRRLDFKHRFDRLGLDEEMKSLIESAKGGHALEMSNIAPSLQSLIDDPAVLERVRAEATALRQLGLDHESGKGH